MSIDAGLVERWRSVFEADLDAALAYRAELQRVGRPVDPEGQAKQLGLSAALTEPEFRCEHYGDFRICPFCTEPDARRSREDLLEENKRLAAENERLKVEVVELGQRLGGSAAAESKRRRRR